MIESKQECRTILEDNFRKWNRGDYLELGEIERITGLDCGQSKKHSESPAYSVIRRAARFIESETNGYLVIRWDRERGRWRALQASDIPEASDQAIRGIRKKSKATASMCAAALSEIEDDGKRNQCLVNMTIANCVNSFVSRSVISKTLRMASPTASITPDIAMQLLSGRS